MATVSKLFPGAEVPAPPAAQPRSTARLRRLADPAPLLLWTTDHDLRFTSCPTAVEGAPVPGTSVVAFYGVEDWDAPPVLAHRQALAGETGEFEHRWRGRVLHCHVEALRDPAGRVIGTLGVGLDVTERQQAEEELHRESELAEVTLASIGDGVIRTDAGGRIDYLNPVAERLTGWNAREAVGRPAAEIFSLYDELSRRPLACPADRCLAENRVVESPGHARLQCRDAHSRASPRLVTRRHPDCLRPARSVPVLDLFASALSDGSRRLGGATVDGPGPVRGLVARR